MSLDPLFLCPYALALPHCCQVHFIKKKAKFRYFSMTILQHLLHTVVVGVFILDVIFRSQKFDIKCLQKLPRYFFSSVKLFVVS